MESKKVNLNHELIQSSIILSILIFSFFVIWNYLNFFNSFILFFIKLGSLLLLVNLFFLYKQGKNFWFIIKKNYFDKYNWFKYSTYGLLCLILIIIFLELPDKEDLKIQSPEQMVNLSKFNPFYLKENSTNLSSFSLNNLNLTLDEISKSFSFCPQINVSMHENSWRSDLSISGTSYQNWTVKGDATCRKGKKEGENLNKYYCGGYTSTFGIGSVNAYVEKTDFEKNGDIGKTYKYVIWNIYDENQNFIETKCIGDPDKFEEEQAEAFYNELRKWN